jgi:hypothetical protein
LHASSVKVAMFELNTGSMNVDRNRRRDMMQSWFRNAIAMRASKMTDENRHKY